MTAKWPSYAQFQGISVDLGKLQAKVNGLTSSAGSASAPLPYISNRDHVGYLPMSGEESTTITGRVLIFRWKHYSVAPAGLYLPENLTVDDIYYIEIWDNFDGPSNGAGRYGADVAKITQRDSAYFDFGEKIPTLTEGYMALHLQHDVTFSGTPAPTLPQGVSVEVQDSEGNVVPGVPTALLTVLRESDVMVRPQYVAPAFGVAPTDNLQIIWPLGGQPSLVVAGSDGTTFYTPLTPGLPQ